MNEIKQLIQSTRLDRDLSRSQVATLVAISQGHLWAVERGAAVPSPTLCESLAAVLDAPEIALARWEVEAAVTGEAQARAQERIVYWAGRVEVVS